MSNVSECVGIRRLLMSEVAVGNGGDGEHGCWCVWGEQVNGRGV